MPNARGEITNHDVRRMRELRAAGMKIGAVASEIGVHRWSVVKYAGDVVPDRSVLYNARRQRALMKSRAERYLGFVERAAQLGAPLLVPPSPF